MTLRTQVFDRDGGVCAECKTDTEAILNSYMEQGRDRRKAVAAVLWDWGHSPKGAALWEADHIQAKALGGADELDNLQTLCVKCHAVKTRLHDVPTAAKWRKKRKKNDRHKARMRAKWE